MDPAAKTSRDHKLKKCFLNVLTVQLLTHCAYTEFQLSSFGAVILRVMLTFGLRILHSTGRGKMRDTGADLKVQEG